MNSWNTVVLETPQEIDMTKELWVGYHISTPTGYPAGVDDGPAINGFGNMIYYDSTWQTLLDLNSELNYNWNIKFYFVSYPFDEDLMYYVYRDVNEQGFEYYDQSMTGAYTDTAIELSDYYCYYVSLVWAGTSDTCLSPPTNSVCEVLLLGADPLTETSAVEIYPNPASTCIKINSTFLIRQVKVYDVLGDCLLKVEIGKRECSMNVSGLKNGIYFLEVVTERQNYKKKILVCR